MLENLTGIVGKIRQVDQLMAEVATASREQSQGVAQVNGAVTQMDKVVQSNAASAEESASAATELTVQARSLRVLVADLLHLADTHDQPVAVSHATERPEMARKSLKPTPAARNGHKSSSRPVVPAKTPQVNGRAALPMPGEFQDF